MDVSPLSRGYSNLPSDGNIITFSPHLQRSCFFSASAPGLRSQHQSSVKLLTRIIYCVAQSVYKVRRSDKNLSPCVSFLDDLWFQVIDSQSNFVFGLNGNDTFILSPSAVDVVMHIIRVIEMMNAHITIMMYAGLHFQRLPHPA